MPVCLLRIVCSEVGLGLGGLGTGGRRLRGVMSMRPVESRQMNHDLTLPRQD